MVKNLVIRIASHSVTCRGRIAELIQHSNFCVHFFAFALLRIYSLPHKGIWVCAMEQYIVSAFTTNAMKQFCQQNRRKNQSKNFLPRPARRVLHNGKAMQQSHNKGAARRCTSRDSTNQNALFVEWFSPPERAIFRGVYGEIFALFQAFVGNFDTIPRRGCWNTLSHSGPGVGGGGGGGKAIYGLYG